MRKLIFTILLSLICFTVFSQAVSISDLLSVYNKPNELPNNLLISHEFTVVRRIKDKGQVMMMYKRNIDADNEESISTGLGFWDNDKKFRPDLYYMAKDSNYVVNLRKQVSEGNYKLDNKNVSEASSSWKFSDDNFIWQFTLIRDKNYMVMLSRKYE